MNSNILSVSQCIGILAEKALIAEASLSPKPGLVDRFSNGSHKDMTYETFVRSSESLQGYFRMAAFVGYSIQDNMIKRQMLKSLGMKAEEIMLEATGGVNTHKGAIWNLGLISAAIGTVYRENRTNATPVEMVAEILQEAGMIARQPVANQNDDMTRGQEVKRKYGFKGAAWEAQQNFPHVFEAWNIYRKERQRGCSGEVASGNTLLYLMQELDDTCVCYRGGIAGLNWLKAEASEILASGGYNTQMKRIFDFDRACVEKNLSPGGSADLLGAALFMNDVVPLIMPCSYTIKGIFQNIL